MFQMIYTFCTDEEKKKKKKSSHKFILSYVSFCVIYNYLIRSKKTLMVVFSASFIAYKVYIIIMLYYTG